MSDIMPSTAERLSSFVAASSDLSTVFDSGRFLQQGDRNYVDTVCAQSTINYVYAFSLSWGTFSIILFIRHWTDTEGIHCYPFDIYTFIINLSFYGVELYPRFSLESPLCG
ncbi:hypothetical protein CHS0354_002862 [Potamilus streckersoni]|uniref:Uncharacterized protein n=1 Tax=Potamilus streckersoni TaxID=2493646 RepID=A0AAE0SNQ9_9BIVA|nr:hypothetical protein CHS0354_002862 [Potamilus streckersoni]